MLHFRPYLEVNGIVIFQRLCCFSRILLCLDCYLSNIMLFFRILLCLDPRISIGYIWVKILFVFRD